MGIFYMVETGTFNDDLVVRGGDYDLEFEEMEPFVGGLAEMGEIDHASMEMVAFDDNDFGDLVVVDGEVVSPFRSNTIRTFLTFTTTPVSRRAFFELIAVNMTCERR